MSLSTLNVHAVSSTQMNGPPTRYFPGRAPTVKGFHSDDSDADGDEASTGGGGKASRDDSVATQPPVRRRIAARVVKAGTNAANPISSIRGTSSSFVPVKGAADEACVQLTASASESGSSSSNDSSDENDAFVTTQVGADITGPDSAYGDGKEVTRPMLRPVFVQPDLKAVAQKRIDREHQSQSEGEHRLDIRRKEAKRLLAQALHDEQRRRDAAREHEVLPDDTDRPEDRDAEYALWKVREILRIRRDREETRAWQNRSSLPSSVSVEDVED